MINWLWLIPAFIVGGMFGFMIFSILSVGAAYDRETIEEMNNQ